MEYNGKCLISVDWLSIYVSTAGKRQPKNGAVEVLEYGTQVYKYTENYMKNGNIVAILTHSPRSSALKADTGIIKFHNSVLYTANLYNIVTDVLQDWGLLPLSVSRLDICADFHTFNGYTKMQAFFSDFLNTKIWKIGKAKYKIIGTKEYAQDKELFAMQGVQAAKHSFQYLRFGGNTSDVAAYLYNKSQEFRDVKCKNYICDMWERNRLNQNTDVWRLEFSLKGNAIKFVNQRDGVIVEDKLQFLKCGIELQRIFATLYKKYWDFRVNDGQVRKDRMQRLNLLSVRDTPYKAVKYSLCDTSGIADKRLITSMERVYNELRNKNMEQESLLKYAINYLVDAKCLNAWWRKKHGE